MPLTVHTSAGHYIFDGPHQHTNLLSDASGVYVITTRINGLHSVIDAGESAAIRSRVNSHDRQDQWAQHAGNNTLFVSALYCDERNRMIIEQQVRVTHQPPCGIR